MVPRFLFFVAIVTMVSACSDAEEQSPRDPEQDARERVAREYCASQSSCDKAGFDAEYGSIGECEEVVALTLKEIEKFYGKACGDTYFAYYDCVGDDYCTSERCTDLAEKFATDCPQ